MPTCTCTSWQDCTHLCIFTYARSQVCVSMHVVMITPNIIHAHQCTHDSTFQYVYIVVGMIALSCTCMLQFICTQMKKLGNCKKACKMKMNMQL